MKAVSANSLLSSAWETTIQIDGGESEKGSRCYWLDWRPRSKEPFYISPLCKAMFEGESERVLSVFDKN